MRYKNCIFDLYGTLVDIRTDERSPRLWGEMADRYRKHGADYAPGELRDALRANGQADYVLEKMDLSLAQRIP